MLTTTPVTKVYNIRSYSRRFLAAGWLIAFGSGAAAMYLLSNSSAHGVERAPSQAAAVHVSRTAAARSDVTAGKSAARLALLSDLARMTREAKRESPNVQAESPQPTAADATETPERQEIELLQRALPDNTLIPRHRNEAELQRQLADIQEQQRLYPQIRDQTASERERHFYYELQAKRFEDELELTDYCDDELAESQPAQRERLPFCSQISARSAEVHRAAEASLAQLRQELL